MDCHVAARAFTAGLESKPPVRHTILAMEPGVALQAKLSSLASYQEHPVGVAVRVVARGAALHFDRRVLEYERTAFLRVAVHAALEIRLVQARMVQRTMWVVAIRALRQSFGHAVVHWLGKFCLHIAMAVEAQHRLRLFEQTAVQPANFVRDLWDLKEMPLRRLQVSLASVFYLCNQMRRVALVARHPICDVRGVLEIFLLLAAYVAQQAMGGIFFGVRAEMKDWELL